MKTDKNLSDVANKATARTNLEVLSAGETKQRMPAGGICDFAMPTPPAGWLKCNGATISRTTYAELFGAIGTTFGAGNGSTTFKLPDFRGEFRRGWDDGRGIDSNRIFGNSQGDEFKSHTHALWGGDPVDNKQRTAPSLYADDAERAATHLGSIKNSGGNETRPRNISVLTCIKY
jgi:microcystin-dependent protein